MSDDCKFVAQMELKALLTDRRMKLIFYVYIISAIYINIEIEKIDFFEDDRSLENYSVESLTTSCVTSFLQHCNSSMKEYLDCSNETNESDVQVLLEQLNVTITCTYNVPNYWQIKAEPEPNPEDDYTKTKEILEAYYDQLCEFDDNTGKYLIITTLTKLLRYMPQVSYLLIDHADNKFFTHRTNTIAQNTIQGIRKMSLATKVSNILNNDETTQNTTVRQMIQEELDNKLGHLNENLSNLFLNNKKPFVKPTKKPFGKPTNKPFGKPTNKPQHKPSNKSQNKPSKKPPNKPSNKPSSNKKPMSKNFKADRNVH